MPPIKKNNRHCVEKWDKLWNEMASRLVEYKKLHGDCLVPQRYKEDPKLGRWVNKQRENRNTLSCERKQRLDSMGFVWNVIKREPWTVMFQRLVKYKKKHGDCLVPQRYQEDPRLGSWVREQRKNRDNIYGHRLQLLVEIGFSWNAKSSRAIETDDFQKRQSQLLHKGGGTSCFHQPLVQGFSPIQYPCCNPLSTGDSSASYDLMLQRLVHLQRQQLLNAVTDLRFLISPSMDQEPENVLSYQR